MNEGEYKSTVTEVSDWVWGVVAGSFNEQQSISQILVDAAIGMIPVVGDVTAVRDLLAISIRLAKHPEKRQEKMEWAALVLTAFALVPVVGGAIKGVGRLLIREAHNATAIGKLIQPMVEVLNRLGRGDAVKFIRELDLLQYTNALKSKMAELFGRLEGVIAAVLRKARWIIPDGMVEVLKALQSGLEQLRGLVDRMVPEVLKELNDRLKLLQRAMYEGEYLEIPDVLKLKSREAEAKLIEDVIGDAVRKGAEMKYPQNSMGDYEWPGPLWTDLRTTENGPEWVAGFHGPIRAVIIKKGERLFRIIDDPRRAAGSWWCRALPANGRVWREDCAVLEAWNRNGLYVELVAPTDLRVYEGTVSGQLDRNRDSRTYGQYLPGGGEQVLLDLKNPQNRAAAAAASKLASKPTHWPVEQHLGINVPLKTVAAQQLQPHDLEAKVRGAAVITRGEAARIQSADSVNREERR